MNYSQSVLNYCNRKSTFLPPYSQMGAHPLISLYLTTLFVLACRNKSNRVYFVNLTNHVSGKFIKSMFIINCKCFKTYLDIKLITRYIQVYATF